MKNPGPVSQIKRGMGRPKGYPLDGGGEALTHGGILVGTQTGAESAVLTNTTASQSLDRLVDSDPASRSEDGDPVETSVDLDTTPMPVRVPAGEASFHPSDDADDYSEGSVVEGSTSIPAEASAGRDNVLFCYRFLLGREAENDSVVAHFAARPLSELI